MTANKQKTKKPQKAETSTKAVTSKRSKMVITPEMQNAVKESKKLVKEGRSKAEVAREVFAVLKTHERKQVINVFIDGIGLSKAGAGTYYQNCKKT